eukprot:TRINITY_DN5803_c0_g1_i3.p1 TRINITY_DN5803_c0_g1~~TRINITY_DN5803_c0_g1_i3.p1  ORF type:complete len:150 (+),score=18.87 TRINITY_DN5803_c0_g1_i3:34-450(+)
MSKQNEPTQAFLTSVALLVDNLRLTETKTVYDDFPELSRFLFYLECVLSFGLKSGFFSSYTLWDFLCNLNRCIPNVDDLLEEARHSIDTDTGRARVFLRISLNDSFLASYLSALTFNRSLVKYNFLCQQGNFELSQFS